MAEIEWTDEAKSWLQQIYDYIARDNEEKPLGTSSSGFMNVYRFLATSRKAGTDMKHIPTEISASCFTATTALRT